MMRAAQQHSSWWQLACRLSGFLGALVILFGYCDAVYDKVRAARYRKLGGQKVDISKRGGAPQDSHAQHQQPQPARSPVSHTASQPLNGGTPLSVSDFDTAAFSKDPWFRDWIVTQRASQRYPELDLAEETCPRTPHYIPPRDTPKVPPGHDTAVQPLIPRIIFQTWKTHRLTKHMRSAARSWIELNPDYHYALFDDFDCASFVQYHFNENWADTNFNTYELYTSLQSGTARADLWRLLVVWQYGGAYFDSDTRCFNPLRHWVPDNASMVAGMQHGASPHQWGLIYAPRHPFLHRAITYVLQQVKACATAPLEYGKGVCGRYGYGLGIMKDGADPMGWNPHSKVSGSKRWMQDPKAVSLSPERMTGPFPYHAAIESILFENGCTGPVGWPIVLTRAACLDTQKWVKTTAREATCDPQWGEIASQMAANCSGTLHHNFGNLILFKSDYFGYNVEMKDTTVHWESHSSNHPLKSVGGKYWMEASRSKTSLYHTPAKAAEAAHNFSNAKYVRSQRAWRDFEVAQYCDSTLREHLRRKYPSGIPNHLKSAPKGEL